MANSSECKRKLSQYGIELENDNRTLRITARCVPREEDMEDEDPLEAFVIGWRTQSNSGKWSSPYGLLRALRNYGCRVGMEYVLNPEYDEEEYVEYQAEPMECQAEPMDLNDPEDIAMEDDIRMEETEFLPDQEQRNTKQTMGISFGFSALEEVVVDEDNPYFSSRDGVLFTKDMTRLIWYPYGKQDGIYTIPKGVKEIGPWAFAGKPYEFRVIREDGSAVQDWLGHNKRYVKYVYHRNLRRVVMPDSVTVIRDNAFNHCLFLTSVRLSSALKEVQWDAFRGCKELREIELPDSLEYIEPAFAGCDNLRKMRFLGTRRLISRIWKTYSGSRYTTYPGPVPYTPDYMARLLGRYLYSFDYMDGKLWILRQSEGARTEISFETPWFTIIDGVMFNRDRTELIWCDRSKEGAYTVPPTVARIGKRAFADCKKLTKVSISHPGTVIEKRAFFCCEKLEQVEFQDSGSAKRIGDHAFQCCYALRGIRLDQAESIGDYAFYACHCLGPVVKVSKSCGQIGEKAFDLCSKLKYLYVPEILAGFCYEDTGRKMHSSIILR